ncbi:MAG: PilZ domain-containing protein [Planctomycetota bacterium]|jgi:hypothetical protein
MMATSVITAAMNGLVLALTPIERWHAAHRLDGSFMAERWFILTGVAAIIMLTVLFIVVTYNRTAKERSRTSRLFFEYADRRGLNQRECQILLDMAAKAKLKRNESIFTMVAAFNRGATKIIEETRVLQGAQTGKNLNAELSLMREKLGFEKQSPASASSTTKSNKPSSRQIPTGKKLHISHRKNYDLSNIESTVIKNDDMEFAVKLAAPLESSPGELCCVRYYFGASVWEFDTSVVSCHGGILVLNHSDNVRFINRRRFLRVPVNKPAFIARFPFARTLPPDSNSDEVAREGSANISGNNWGAPEFAPAVLTELAGPGLRIEAPLEVKVGDRVVIILKMSEERTQDSISHAKGISLRTVSLRDGKTAPAKIVEDIGEVRHTKAIQNGFSIAVELTGLSDSNINELIRDTNAASVKTSGKTRDVPEPTVLQGV